DRRSHAGRRARGGVALAIAGVALSGALAAFAAPPAAKDAKPAAPPAGSEPARFFETEVRPLLAANCLACHGGAAVAQAGLRLTSRAELLKGGNSGPAVSPGKPDESLLLKAINYQGPPMPPRGRPPPAQIHLPTRRRRN